MFDSDKWQEIFETMKKNRLRTILTAFSVAWGIFILIVLLAAGQGLKNGAQSEFGNDARNSIWIEGGETSMAYAGYKPGRKIQLTNADYEFVKHQIKGIDRISASYRPWESKVLSYKNEHAGFTVRPCTPDHMKLEGVELIKGRFINEIDIKEIRKVCVLGLPVKNTLFKDEDPINKFIDVAGTKYKVIGYFNDIGRGDNDRIYVPLASAQKLSNNTDHLNMIWATTGNSTLERTEEMTNQIRQRLARKYHFNPEDQSAMGVWNSNVGYARVMGMLDGIKLFLYIIGVLTLIAGIVGVSNIMLIIVKERNKEIGVRKALGATPFSIVSLIIQESVFITFLAGYAGLMAGIGVIELLKAMGLEGAFFKDPDVDLSIALSSLGLIILSGALAGLFPALKAARVEPITALRED